MPLERPSLALAGFPDGRWLIAATNGYGEPNGRLFGCDGTLLARLHLADRVWVGWFDDGLSCNMDRLSENIDQTAVVAACLAADGAMLPVGPAPDEAGFLAYVCAATVTEDGAWVCPYTEFSLLHLRPGQPVR